MMDRADRNLPPENASNQDVSPGPTGNDVALPAWGSSMMPSPRAKRQDFAVIADDRTNRAARRNSSLFLSDPADFFFLGYGEDRVVGRAGVCGSAVGLRRGARGRGVGAEFFQRKNFA